MIIDYNGMQAEISYSATTKCYYGEIEYNDNHVVVFQTSSKQELIEIMKKTIEQFTNQARFS